MTRYRVGDGQVSCCYTSGCNKDIVTARGSYESQSIPFRQEAFKKQSLIKVSQKLIVLIYDDIIVGHVLGWSCKLEKWSSVIESILDYLVL